ncbi:MAG: methyltransferase domain-containing protein [Candidatus Eremiobacteraeota bacterium]|nr:methyltransferase domain-containing protein [Candidatus Eremiobacteraeota bacterium]MBV8355682.1 methyltransferase domain-containing protein [Candidatus Eremiobacteraeota bacterium]
MASSTGYPLGYADAEKQRLVRQAVRFGAILEAFLRDAGIREGDRVLDVGSGLGDVALALARLVTYRGAVLGLERDTASIATARARVTTIGVRNVTFLQADVETFESAERFDAVVGRFILVFLPDRAAAIRRLGRLLRPGGVIAFQEPLREATQAINAHLPLQHACGARLREAFAQAGADTEIGGKVYALFQEAGLRAPQLRCDAPIDGSDEMACYAYDLLVSALHSGKCGEPQLAEFESLPHRLPAEMQSAKSCCAGPILIGAWAQVP